MSSQDPARLSPTLSLVVAACAGSALGAVTMALLDPVSGRRRQKSLREGWARLCGFAARPARAATLQPQPTVQAAEPGPSDEALLLARIQLALGRLCEDADAIEVRLRDGVVELHGEVHKMQRRRVLQGVRKLWGVGEVRSFLHTFDRHTREDSAQVLVH